MNQLLTDREARVRKELAEKFYDGTIIPIVASALLRSRKRKEKEPFPVYRRAMANMQRALKARLRAGPTAQVFIDKTDYRVCNAKDTARLTLIAGATK